MNDFMKKFLQSDEALADMAKAVKVEQELDEVKLNLYKGMGRSLDYMEDSFEDGVMQLSATVATLKKFCIDRLDMKPEEFDANFSRSVSASYAAIVVLTRK